MSRLLFALSLGFGGLIWIAQTAQAQTTNCADRAKIVQQLQTRFGEVRQSMGMQGSTTIIEVFVSDKSHTWSILVTRPNGISCLVAAGQDWQDSPEAANDDPGA